MRRTTNSGMKSVQDSSGPRSLSRAVMVIKGDTSIRFRATVAGSISCIRKASMASRFAGARWKKRTFPTKECRMSKLLSGLSNV